MAIAMEMTEPAAVAERADEARLEEVLTAQEQEAAEFIVRQVLDRGATFFDG